MLHIYGTCCTYIICFPLVCHSDSPGPSGEAWTLLRIFPQELLKKIPQKLKECTVGAATDESHKNHGALSIAMVVPLSQ